jgi:hypothetical protein
MKEIANEYYVFTEEIRRIISAKGHGLLQETRLQKTLDNFGKESVLQLSPPVDLSAGDNYPIDDEYLCRAASGNTASVIYVVPKDLIYGLL